MAFRSLFRARPLQSSGVASKRSKRTGKAAIVAVVVLGLLGGGGYAYYRFVGFGSASSKAQPLTIEVVSGPFDHIVLEQGEVESSSNIDVVCEVKARGGSGTPILWVIDEGTYVKKGDKLVELDASALENEAKAQRIAVSSAEALVISSEANVRTAQIALQEYLEGTYLSERKAILSEIAVAEQELRKTELQLSSARRLAAKGMLKGLQIEAEEFAVANARNVLESAQARLRVLDELTKEKNKVQFESDIEAAIANLKSDQSVLQEEQEKMVELEDQMAKCVMYSPAEGVVVHNNEFSSRGGAEFVVEEGATVRERQTIIKLPDPGKMQVKANVNESRITLISQGMPSKVKVGAVANEMLARVKRVNKYAEPGSWFSSSVKEYATFIEILNPPASIRTGMTAEVRIFVEQLENALQIPVHGVYEFKGHHFCLVKDGENWKTEEVEIGATNEEMVTIDSGLVEGDTVALNPRKYLNLMDLPEIEEVDDREALTKMSAEASALSAAAAKAAKEGRPTGGAPSGGAASGGPPAGGAAGGMMSRLDTDSDGKLSSAELDALGAEAKKRMLAADSNGDGELDSKELQQMMSKWTGGGAGGR